MNAIKAKEHPMATIVSIVYKPEKTTRTAQTYHRVPLDTAELVTGHGIKGDLKGGHPKRQINIMCHETLDQLRSEGFQVEPGQMGEQITVTGLDINALKPGERVQIGTEAIIEIVEPRTGCDRFEQYQGRHPSAAAGRLGQMAKVVQSGTIQVGDTLKMIAHV